jgi:hypothetical protein
MHPHMAELEPLIGDWEMEAVVDDKVMMRGTSTFAWSEHGPYLVQTGEGGAAPDAPAPWHDNLPFPTVSVIGIDDVSEEYSVLYSDARGVQRIYEMTFAGGAITQFREAPGFHQRFSGELSRDGKRIDARWERSDDGENWFLDFELTYRRKP